MNKKGVRLIVAQALIAAVYAAMTLAFAPMSFGAIQLRFSEALTVLPFVDPFCTIGLTMGCLIANVVGSGNILDSIFGTLATLIAGLITSRCKNKYLAPLPPVLANAVIVSAVITAASGISKFIAVFAVNAVYIAAGQAVACYILGLMLLKLIESKGLTKIIKGERE